MSDTYQNIPGLDPERNQFRHPRFSTPGSIHVTIGADLVKKGKLRALKLPRWVIAGFTPGQELLEWEVRLICQRVSTRLPGPSMPCPARRPHPAPTRAGIRVVVPDIRERPRRWPLLLVGWQPTRGNLPGAAQAWRSAGVVAQVGQNPSQPLRQRPPLVLGGARASLALSPLPPAPLLASDPCTVPSQVNYRNVVVERIDLTEEAADLMARGFAGVSVVDVRPAAPPMAAAFEDEEPMDEDGLPPLGSDSDSESDDDEEEVEAQAAAFHRAAARSPARPPAAAQAAPASPHTAAAPRVAPRAPRAPRTPKATRAPSTPTAAPVPPAPAAGALQPRTRPALVLVPPSRDP